MTKSGSSPLPSLSRKVQTTPPVGVVSSLKFRKERDLELLLSWVQSSTASLKRIQTPSKKKIKDLGKKSKSDKKKGGFGLPMLPLLGIGGALGLGTAAGLMGGGSGGKDGEKNPLAKGISTGTDLTGNVPKEIKLPKRTVDVKGKGVKPKIKTTTLKPQKIALNKGLKGVGRKAVKGRGKKLVIADAAMTTVDRLQEGQTAKQAFVGGAAEATGSFLGFGKGFKIGAALTAKAAAPLIVAPIPGARILYAAAVLTGGIAGGFIGSKIGRSVSGGLADKLTGVQKKLENVKPKKKEMGRSYNKRKRKKTIAVPVDTSQNANNTMGGGNNMVNTGSSGGQQTTGGNTTVVYNNNPQEELLLSKLDSN